MALTDLEPEKAADLSAVLCLVGVIFAFLSRYAVNFWATLHQGTSISVTGSELSSEFLYPLLIMMFAFFLTFVALLLLRVRTEIRLRRARAIRLATAER